MPHRNASIHELHVENEDRPTSEETGVRHIMKAHHL